MIKKYSEAELNKAYLSLSDQQKKVLDEYIKRGKKTKWLNIWAGKKGDVLSEEELEDPDKAMESLLQWVLLDHEDRLKVDPNLRCECGRPLRHRYTVLHKETGEIYRLGIVHFQQHTGLEPEMVRLITKGLQSIDLEREEILSKVIENWSLPMSIPPDMEIPKDMAEQLRVKLPLLNRQIMRLYELIEKHLKEKGRYKIVKPLPLKSSIANAKPKAPEGVSRVDTPSCDYISDIQPFHLYNKLKAMRLSAGEARDLFLYISHYSSELDNYGLTVDDIKAAARKALGYFGNMDIRRWLVEIRDYRG